MPDDDRVDGFFNAGTCVHCGLFPLYDPIVVYATAFDDEKVDIYKVLLQLQNLLEHFSKGISYETAEQPFKLLIHKMNLAV